jgi:glycyl-tRNA synthetase beta chain (EC 6.1.1.14)
LAKHERFFPVRAADGSLTNRFVSVRNGGREEDVRRGNEWVLNARFNDARFFFEEDRNRIPAARGIH